MMSEEIKYYKDYKIRIVCDEMYESPDNWGNEDLFLVYSHRQFTVKREGFEPIDIYESGLAYEEEHWIFPVEAYIHSRVSLSLYDGNKQCHFDSSVSGYILARKKDFEDFEIAKKAAESLIETWNQYLSGEVYGFIIEKPNIIYSIEQQLFKNHLEEGTTIRDLEKDFMIDHEWEEIDSCWGYYGNPEESGLLDEVYATIDNLTSK